MYMKTDDGRFVKTQLEEFRNKETELLWILVDNVDEATDDPAWVAGDDLTIPMLQFLRQHFNVSALSCYSPEEEKEVREENPHVTSTARRVVQAEALLVACADSKTVDGINLGEAFEDHCRLASKAMMAEPICERSFDPHGLPRERFSHRRPEMAYGQKFNRRPRGRIR